MTFASPHVVSGFNPSSSTTDGDDDDYSEDKDYDNNDKNTYEAWLAILSYPFVSVFFPVAVITYPEINSLSEKDFVPVHSS